MRLHRALGFTQNGFNKEVLYKSIWFQEAVKTEVSCRLAVNHRKYYRCLKCIIAARETVIDGELHVGLRGRGARIGFEDNFSKGQMMQ